MVGLGFEVGRLESLGADHATVDLTIPAASTPPHNEEHVDHNFWLTRHSYIVEAFHGFEDNPDLDMEWRISLWYVEELNMLGIELDGKLTIDMPLTVPIVPEETIWELDAAAGTIIISMESRRERHARCGRSQTMKIKAPTTSPPKAPPPLCPQPRLARARIGSP